MNPKLKWLFYLTVVIFLFGVAGYFGLENLIIENDPLYLSRFLFLVYLAAEVTAGINLWKLSKEVKTDRFVDNVKLFVMKGPLTELVNDYYVSLENDFLFSEFLSRQIVVFGILGTIVGVIVAFLPFISMDTIDVNAISAHLKPFFNGVATAFFPTALSFVFKIILDFNTLILRKEIDSVIHEAINCSNGRF